MIGSKLLFGNFDLSKRGIIESADYDNLSVDIITLKRAMAIDKFFDFKRSLKEVNVSFRLFNAKVDARDIENKLDEIIAELHYQGLSELKINDYSCQAFLVNAKRSTHSNTGLLELRFINFDGVFYGKEKTERLPGNIFYSDIISTENIIIELMPTQTSCQVMLNGNKLRMLEVSINKKITIDMKDKTVKQNGVYVKLTNDSNFFELRRGYNNITTENCTGEIKYKGVSKL